MNVAVIGGGNVGGRLATRWHELGHQVVVGRRDPRAPAVHLGRGVPSAAPAEAIVDAEVVVLALPADTALAAAEALPLDGRIVVDAMNMVRRPLPVGFGSLFAAVAATLAAASPSARPVKAFNTLGAETINDPRVAGHPAFLPVAADDVDAATAVVRLATDLGYDAVHVGGAERGADLEAMARLWMALAFGPGALGRGIAIGLLRR